MEGSDLDVLGPVDYLVVEFPAKGGLCDSLRGESRTRPQPRELQCAPGGASLGTRHKKCTAA